MDDADLAERMTRARAGDEAAVEELMRYFEPEVRTVVRHRLPRALRQKFDSMDFVQAVWTSVFAKDGLDRAEFNNAGHFLGYLAGVAKNKVYEEHRRRSTRKYDLGREEPLYYRRGNREVAREVPAGGPSPSAPAQARDRLAQIMKDLGSPERQVVELRLQDMTFVEIGQKLGMHESAVRRIFAKIWERMEDRGWQ